MSHSLGKDVRWSKFGTFKESQLLSVCLSVHVKVLFLHLKNYLFLAPHSLLAFFLPNILLTSGIREKEVTVASSGITRPRMRRDPVLVPSLHTTLVSS